MSTATMQRGTLLKFALIGIAMMSLPGLALAGTAEDVIAATRAQWQAEIDGKSAAEQMAIAADDYTEFNPDYATRLDGKEANLRLTEAGLKGSGRTIAAEMTNPKVQEYGDVAILTYNYAGVSLDKDGKTHSIMAKSTRVFAKRHGKWLLVHANFAPVLGEKD